MEEATMAKTDKLETKPFRLKPGRKFHVPRTDGVSGTRLVKAGQIVELTPDQQKAFKDAFEPVDKPKPKKVEEVEDDEDEVVDDDEVSDDEEVEDEDGEGDEEETDDEESDDEATEETPKQRRAREREEKKAAKAAGKKAKKKK